ncbi:MAG: ATP-binding cassette domain-containing protein [Candidatus Acetothermia bacterium]|jgi:ATP-binding cassette subfamily F protein 3|nr:ATP-binding cassette domain-containing protein [Candidatus Acetothermia bacterium]MDH7505805.1 ABC-F family ATP-binding cassette domain-containing protein [Candidatus Acetothermia bacterium]
MSLIRAEDLGKRYGAQTILAEIDLQIARGERIALIGDNGSGKSTLLKLIAGLEEPSSGRIVRAREVRIGYLPQEPLLDSARPLFAEMLEVFAPLQEQEAELRRLEEALACAPDSSELLLRYDSLREGFERAGGYRYESEIRQVLAGLELAPAHWERPLAQLSGGERARAALAKLILERPDLLLLDEPSNHLDFAAVEWLEEYLSKWEGSYLLVSHDRLLLDRLAEKTWELAGGKLYKYRGNYSKYLELRRAQEEQQLELHERQQAQVAKMEEFIRRVHAGQKHRQAKDRERKLARLEPVELPPRRRKLRFSFELGRASGQEVLRFEGLVVGYPGRALFRCPDLVLRRGSRVALIGPNGSGKTTLLRTILGELPPLAGTVELGFGVQPGYFAQVQEFPAEKTVLEAILDGRSQTVGEARAFLGRFLFSGEEVFKRLDELSGGELSRLALARLAHTRGNLLLLDEPTNHLDISSQEVLQEALEEFEGTVLFVSHDRYLVDRLATQVWEVRAGELRVYEGDYDYYRRKRAEEAAGAEPQQPARRKERPVRVKAEAGRDDHEAALLERAAALEGELARLEQALVEASYAQDLQRINELHSSYKQKREELESTLKEWELLARS